MKKKITQYAIYYGYGLQEELSINELIIVEPKAQNDESLKVLKQHGALVLAYISFMEVAKVSLSECQLEGQDLILTVESTPIVNSFGNYLVDFRNEKWQKDLFDSVSTLCGNKKYDGLFIDTIGNLESSYLISVYSHELHTAYKEWLNEIRKKYPETLIIQNNGLDSVLDYSKEMIDGVCWENPPIGHLESILWVVMIRKRLIAIREKKPAFLIMLLEEKDRYQLKTKMYAKKNGWLYYMANHDYL